MTNWATAPKATELAAENSKLAGQLAITRDRLAWAERYIKRLEAELAALRPAATRPSTRARRAAVR